MNKLRKKIFWTILIILSLFLTSILLIFNYQNYNHEKMNIEKNLFRMDNIKPNRNPKIKEEIFDKPDDNSLKRELKRFVDATIYTILLDSDNKILKIISHTEDGLVREDIQSIASKIILENTKNKTYIGNLYIDNYAYHYEFQNHITLIDITDVKKRLISSLKITLLLFFFAVIMIIMISKILSEWIIKPVEITFQKQKQFIADASHELKTPLSVIMACAESLENNPKEQKWLNTIKSESNRMSQLITNLLDLARIENEKKALENNNLSKITQKSTLTFESLAYEKNIQLTYEIEDDIFFPCNHDEIKQLLSILLDNAIKHSPKNGNIMVLLKENKNNIILEVSNQGKPIPVCEREKIFERFYRIDPSRNRDENRYGLGLAIAKNIVTNHRGKILVSSDQGYTTFKIIFKK